MDPHAAFLLLRGIKTLAVRVERQNESALRVAEFLAQHPKVRSVNYPFLQGHPQRALAMEQMKGGGGVLSFEVDGTGEDAKRLSEALRLFTLAPSLGGVDSLVSIPVLTSHAMISPDLRQKMGVTEQLIRLSVGIENVDDLIADIEQALRQWFRRQSSTSRSAETMSAQAAIIGLGFVGKAHLEALRRLGIPVRGILGSSPERTQEAARELKIRARLFFARRTGQRPRGHRRSCLLAQLRSSRSIESRAGSGQARPVREAASHEHATKASR